MAPPPTTTTTTTTDTAANPPSSLNPSQINKFPYLKPHQFPGAYVRPLKKHKNMETRARAGPHHGGLPFGKDLEKALYGYGNATHPDIPLASKHPDSNAYLARPVGATNYSGAYSVPVQPQGARPPTPFHTGASSAASKDAGGEGPELGGANAFPETVRVLDEIVTDFIIEVCHEAVDHATYEGRHKVNPQDLHFVFRNDQEMLGRIREMAGKQKIIKKDKKGLDSGPGDDVRGGAGAGGLADVKKLTVEALQELGDVVGEEGTGRGKGRGRGKRRKKVKEGVVEGEEDVVEGGSLVGGGAAGVGAAGGDSENGEGADGASVSATGRPQKRARSEAT